MPLRVPVGLGEVSRVELGRGCAAAQLQGHMFMVIYLTGATQESFGDCTAQCTWHPRVDGQYEGPGAPVTGRPPVSPTDAPSSRASCSTLSQILLPLLFEIFSIF